MSSPRIILGEGDSRKEKPIHVYPVNDIWSHKLEGTFCECNPKIMEWDNLKVHDSLDRRECFEG